MRWTDESGTRLESIRVFEVDLGNALKSSRKNNPTPQRGQEYHWQAKMRGQSQQRQQEMAEKREQKHARQKEKRGNMPC